MFRLNNAISVVALFPLAAGIGYSSSSASAESLIVFDGIAHSGDVYTLGPATIEDSSTQESINHIERFYGYLADEMLSFLRDDENLDFEIFEGQLKSLLQYDEMSSFCSFLLAEKNDEDLCYFLKGVIETDVDIYSDSWYADLLRDILRETQTRRSIEVRHLAQVILDEYY